MVLPSWFTQASLASETAHKRSSGVFTLDKEAITLEFVGATQVAVVKSYHRGHNFIPGRVIWVKKVADEDGTTLLDVQGFEEDALGALRGFILVHTVEGAKVKALDVVAAQLPKNLTAYLLNGSSGELPWALSVHLAVLDLFSETPKGDFAFANRQIRRLFSVFDRTGRINRRSRVMGVESSIQRIRKVSKKRQKTAGAAALAAATLGEVLKNYEAFINNVTMFIETKLDANTWRIDTKRNRKWLESFSRQLSTWTDDFFKMDMQPFTNDANTVGLELLEAHDAITAALLASDKQTLDGAQKTLKKVLKIFKSMNLRFETARALHIISLAADERMKKFNIKVSEPNWLEIDAIARRAAAAWGVNDESVISDISARNAERAYAALRKIVRAYDNASRAAA